MKEVYKYYAYLGEADKETAEKIMTAFPYITIINTTINRNGHTWYELGVPRNLGEEVVGLYLMVVQLWGDKELQKEIGEIIVRG